MTIFEGRFKQDYVQIIYILKIVIEIGHFNTKEFRNEDKNLYRSVSCKKWVIKNSKIKFFTYEIWYIYN